MFGRSDCLIFPKPLRTREKPGLSILESPTRKALKNLLSIKWLALKSQQTSDQEVCCLNMNSPGTDDQLTDRILKVLELQETGTAEEIAFTIAELQGISSEEGNAEIIQAVKEQVEKLTEAGKLEEVRSRHAAKRYKIINK